MNLELKRWDRIKWQSTESNRRRRKWVLLWGSILIGGFLLIYFFALPSKPLSPPTLPTESIPSIPEEPKLQVIEGDVKEKSTLFKSLSEKNVPLRWIDLVISKLKPHVNFKKIKGGTYRLFIDAKGELVKFIYEAGPTEIYEVEKDPQGYIAQRKKVSLETHLVKIEGEIHSSLFEAMDAIGEKDPLTIAFAEVLAWEIDFYKDVREGDKFKVVVEKIYKGDQFIQYGAIHAVEYQRGLKVIRGIRYKGDYYNDKGISLKKAFLKAPLRFNQSVRNSVWRGDTPSSEGFYPILALIMRLPPGRRCGQSQTERLFHVVGTEGLGNK